MLHLSKTLHTLLICFCCFWVTQPLAFAITPLSDRVAIEAKVRADIGKDLAIPYNPIEELADRQCLDGRPVKDFSGDIIEYWVNLECTYCGIREPLQAQRANLDMCIVVRHIPTDQYGESLKKALSYEALKKFYGLYPTGGVPLLAGRGAHTYCRKEKTLSFRAKIHCSFDNRRRQ